MGITTQFCPDLALRNIKEFKEGKRKEQECLPEELKVGEVYDFLKKGQRLYWFSDDEEWGCGQLALFETKGSEVFSRPIASIKIIEATHFLENKEIWTRGKYKIIDVFDPNDPKIHFEACKRVK